MKVSPRIISVTPQTLQLQLQMFILITVKEEYLKTNIDSSIVIVIVQQEFCFTKKKNPCLKLLIVMPELFYIKIYRFYLNHKFSFQMKILMCGTVFIT